jgi:signal transduction histidine kinase
MNKQNQDVQGFAVICDERGIINEILRDDFNIIPEYGEGKLFFSIVDSENRSKAMRFMADIKAEKVAFDYQMNIMVSETLKTFSFIGILVDDNFLIIGAGNYQEAIEFTNFLQEVNNEQANMIRQLVKEKGELKKQKEKTGEELSLNDLSELNNELINLQREMSKKNSELARLNETKNRFLGMAAHDLRSPLSVIHSYSQYLMDKTKDVLPEKYTKFLETIFSTSQFMLSLIEDLLDISKIESGKMELNLETFDLIALARKNIELNQALAEKKNIELNLELNIQKVEVNADKHKIEQVFNNLLSNAIKFSHPKTAIIVKIFTEEQQVYIHVKDKGKGIPKDKQESLFQPFSAHSTIGTEGEKGTGLGLAISKRIVEEHGGEIWVESEQNKGSTFKFNLPNASAKEKTHSSSPYNWNNKTILLIEDDEANRLFIQKVLEPTQANVISCADGEEGMQKYYEHPETNLILLDLNLPVKSGFEIIREIRNKDKKIPIIVQTAYAWSGDKQTAIVIGSSDYYTKPIDKDSFLSILKNYLN